MLDGVQQLNFNKFDSIDIVNLKVCQDSHSLNPEYNVIITYKFNKNNQRN